MPDRNKFSYLSICWTDVEEVQLKKKNKRRRKIKIAFSENINKAL